MEISREVLHHTMARIQPRLPHNHQELTSTSAPGSNSKSNSKPSSSSRGSRQFTEIGSGGCAIIYEVHGTGFILKKQITSYNLDDPQTHTLWHDYVMHHKVSKAFSRSSISDMSIPSIKFYHGSKSKFKEYLAWWQENDRKFPEGSRRSSPVIQAERITPLALKIRDEILERFCHPTVKLLARTSRRHRACLIAPLLGSRRGKHDRGDHMRVYEDIPDLRNFELHVDQMETLQMDIWKYCELYAHALAIMHYSAGIDAIGVKFRLGSKPHKTSHNSSDTNRLPFRSPSRKRSEPSLKTSTKASSRSAHLWLLDFDKCNRLECGPNFLRQAVHGFTSSPKSYWPHPQRDSGAHAADAQYWTYFSQRYIFFAERFTTSQLPREFIKAVEQHYASEGGAKIVDGIKRKRKRNGKIDTSHIRPSQLSQKYGMLGDLHSDKHVQMPKKQTPQLEYSVRLQLLRRGMNLDTF